MVTLDGPVGQRWKQTQVQNLMRDQEKIISMLASISAVHGGKKEGWEAWTEKPTIFEDGFASPKLVDAIWDFQVHWQRFGVVNIVDGVVDRNGRTIQALNDLQQPQVRPDPKPGHSVEVAAPQDILVRFTGAPVAAQKDEARNKGFQARYNTVAYLGRHQPVETLCFTGLSEQSRFISETINRVAEIRKGQKNGVTIVTGFSAGATSALRVAVELSQQGIGLDYVGIGDGAFFERNGDVLFNPFRIKSPGTIQAKVKECFFQTFGHKLFPSSKRPSGFVDGIEFHGPIEGFSPIPLEKSARMMAVKSAWNAVPGSSNPENIPGAAKKPFASQAHNAAGGEADGIILTRIDSLLAPAAK